MRKPGETKQTLAEDDERERFVILGRVSGVYGVQGWVRVQSETQPRQNILGYTPWFLRRGELGQAYRLESGRPQGKAIVAKLAGVDDRDQAAALVGLDIAVKRSQLADDLAPGEYYWVDLEGLAVETVAGVSLGRVDHLMETGANDVLVVQGDRERLIPYLPGQVVVEVDLAAGRLLVDWDPEF